MSAIVALKEGNSLLLGTDSRFMKGDLSGIAEDAQKVFTITPGTFIASSGWQIAAAFQEAKAREIALSRATTDIRIIDRALDLEFVAYLRELAGALFSAGRLEAACGPPDVSGGIPIHCSVLAGWADSKLGFLQREYIFRTGEVVVESSEYFGSKRQIFVRPASDPVQAIAREPRTWNDKPLSVFRRVLAALKAANSRIGGSNQIIELSPRGASWIEQLPQAGRPMALDHGTMNVGGGGINFFGAGGINATGGGNVIVNPGYVAATTVRCSPFGAFFFGTNQGITSTETVQDAFGVGHTVYIQGGIITGWI